MYDPIYSGLPRCPQCGEIKVGDGHCRGCGWGGVDPNEDHRRKIVQEFNLGNDVPKIAERKTA